MDERRHPDWRIRRRARTIKRALSLTTIRSLQPTTVMTSVIHSQAADIPYNMTTTAARLAEITK